MEVFGSADEVSVVTGWLSKNLNAYSDNMEV